MAILALSVHEQRVFACRARVYRETRLLVWTASNLVLPRAMRSKSMSRRKIRTARFFEVG